MRGNGGQTAGQLLSKTLMPKQRRWERTEELKVWLGPGLAGTRGSEYKAPELEQDEGLSSERRDGPKNYLK